MLSRLRTPPSRIAIALGPHMGDGISCLPMAGLLKAHWPQTRITCIAPAKFLAVFEACEHFDDFLDTESVVADASVLNTRGVNVLLNPFPDLEVARAAARARVPVRVGNLRRSKLIPYCNRFVFYGRRHSKEHEAMLNLKELRALGIRQKPGVETLKRYMQLTRVPALPPQLATLLEPSRFNLILHTSSSGNGREWPAAHFAAVARQLCPQRFRVFLTGIEADRERIRAQAPCLFERAHVTELFGKLGVRDLVSFIHAADGLVASGTGPLHLAAALGTRTLGLYPPRKPIDTVRWGPIGARAETLALPGRDCSPSRGGCPKKTAGAFCRCMELISPQDVMQRLLRWSDELPARS